MREVQCAKFNFAPEIRRRLRDSADRQGCGGRHCGRGRGRRRRGDHAGGRRPVRERVLCVVTEGLHVELKVQLARHHRVRHLHLKLLPLERPVSLERVRIRVQNICLFHKIREKSTFVLLGRPNKHGQRLVNFQPKTTGPQQSTFPFSSLERQTS